jgi:fatty acid desaturase
MADNRGGERDTHRAHHDALDITHPRDDPESRYDEHADGFGGRLAGFRATLVGQIMIGPVASIAGFLGAEVRRLWNAPRSVAHDWLPHALAAGLVLSWLAVVEMSLATYFLAFVLPGQALTLLRGFAEHRADAAGPARAATVESRGPLALLFLNNNLHAAHHANPAVPWYGLPAIERARTGKVEPRYAGYRDVISRFALKAHDTVLHPRASERIA